MASITGPGKRRAGGPKLTDVKEYLGEKFQSPRTDSNYSNEKFQYEIKSIGEDTLGSDEELDENTISSFSKVTSYSETFGISFIELSILNKYLYSLIGNEDSKAELIVKSIAHVDEIGRTSYSNAFESTYAYLYDCQFRDSLNTLMFQTKVFKSDGHLITQLHISIRLIDGNFFTSMQEILKRIKTLAFNNSEYTGKCIKVKLHDSRFMGIEIINFDKPETGIVLNEFQEKFIQHFINRIGRGGSARYLFNGVPGGGKAQPLDAKILTPTGWITMGEIKINDIVLTPEGKETKVIGVFPQGEKEIYKITFIDGKTTEACGEHLWKIYQKNYRKPRILNTLEIKNKMEVLERPFRVQLVSDNISHENDVDLVIDPYLMGILLGDGTFVDSGVQLSTSDIEIVDFINNIVGEKHHLVYSSGYDYCLTRKEGKGYKGMGFENEYVGEIKTLGLSRKTSDIKFIPEKYKNASKEQKYSLIQGLMDSDGTVSNGHLSFCTTSKRLALDMQELIWSVGGICKIAEKQTYYTYKGVKKAGKLSYNLAIRHNEPKKFFRLKRKLERVPEKYQYANCLKNNIKSIELVGKKKAQCIMVEDEEHLYVTDNYIVTHNTQSIRNIIRALMPGVTFIIPDFTDVEDLTTILEACEIFTNSVIIMDDIDLYLGSRDNGRYTKLLGEFLSFFDGVKKRKISLLASTNDKNLVDKAAERPGRFNMTIDFSYLTDKQIDAVCKIHLPLKFQIPEVYAALKSKISGRQANITGAFIANLADNIIEMSEDDVNWSTQDTIDLIVESYKGFYISQQVPTGNTGFIQNK